MQVDPGVGDGQIIIGLLASEEYVRNAGDRFLIENTSFSTNYSSTIDLGTTPRFPGEITFHGSIQSPAYDLAPANNQTESRLQIERPRLREFYGTNELALNWPSGTDQFEPEGKAALGGGLWNSAGFPSPADDGSIFSVVIPTTGEKFFVRLRPVFDRCLQDDATGDQLMFNASSGEYRLTPGNGDVYFGTGIITGTNSSLTLLHDTLDRHFIANFNSGTQSGDASFETPRGTLRVRIVDSHIGDNNCP